MTTPGYSAYSAVPNPSSSNAQGSATGPLPTHPMSVPAILRGAVAVFRRNLRPILMISTIGVLVGGLCSVLGATTATTHIAANGKKTIVENPLFSFGGIAVQIWIMAALLFAFTQSALNREVEPGRSLKAGRRRAGWLFLTLLILTVGASIAVIPGTILAAATAAIGGFVGGLFASISVVGTILCLLYVAMRVMLAPTVTVMEEVNSIESLRRSWALTKGRILGLLGTAALTVILILVIVGISLGSFLMLRSNSTSQLVENSLISSLITAIPLVFLNPLVQFIPAVCYVDQRIRLEGFAPVLENAYAETATVPTTPTAPGSPDMSDRVRFDD